MGTRVKTFVSTGVATDGRLYAGDLNAIQDQYADLSNLVQNLGVGTISVGESGLQIVRYGAGEARITGALRTDGIIRALGGLFAGTFTTTQRNALVNPIYGLVILNTTTNQYEWNSGTPSVPAWLPMGGSATTYGTSFPGSPIDGAQHVLVDNTATPTFSWKFRYNAGSTNADKWEFIGGGKVIAVSNAVLSLARAGVYDILISGTLTENANTPVTCTVTPSSGSVAGRNSITNQMAASGGSQEIADGAAQFRVSGVSAGATLTWTGSTGSLSGGVISALPVRLS